MSKSSLDKMETSFLALMPIEVHQRKVMSKYSYIPLIPTNESTAEIIRKKLKEVMDKNKAVSMKFGIFNPTIPSAIQ